MIEVQELTRRYGSLVAVDGLDLSVDKGEVVGFLGPNGAGKTTTMRILTGYLPATRAKRLVVADHDVQRDSMAVRRSIGYLPESVPLYPELRVDEMMRFQGRLHRMERSDLRARIPEVLERVGVLDRTKQLVGTLSRGLKQRVGLAVALLPAPEVLILDEPTSGLDPIQRAEVRRLIVELSSEHTVLLSSHILAEIESMAPRVAIIHEGRKVADGSKEEILKTLGGDDVGHVSVELAAPATPEEVAALLRELPGVTSVEAGLKVGIHQAYKVFGEGDLREDVGALAMTRSWALRELSWVRPSLEQLFTHLVIGEAVEGGASPPSAPGAAQAEPKPELSLGLAPSVAAPNLISASGELPLGTPGTQAKRTIYSLNPFDRGASRDLSKPVDVDAPPDEGTENDS